MPTSCCAVPTCKNRKARHAFPLKNKQLLKVWLILIRRDKFKPNANSRICADHFTPQDFIPPSKESLELGIARKILRRGAVPSIFPWTSPLQVAPTERELRSQRREEQKE